MKVSVNDFNFILKSAPVYSAVVAGDSPITPIDIIHTSSGSVIIGFYNSSATYVYDYNNLDPSNPTQSYLLPATSNNGVFIMMYNNSGALQWMSQIDGTYDEQSVAIASGSDGIYLSGRYNSNDVKVYNGALPNALSTYINLPTPSSNAVFLVKFSFSGVVQWATYIDGTNNEYTTALSVANDEIYLTGYYDSNNAKAYYANPSNPANPTQSVNLPTMDTYSTFLIQYNKLGQIRWIIKIDNVHPEQNYILSADNSGLYLIGEFNLSDGSPMAYGYPLTGAGYPNAPTVSNSLDATDGFSIFIVKYLNNGVVAWMTNMESGSDLYVKDITSDTSGVYILASYVGDSVNIHDTSNNTIILPSSNTVKSFITRYSPTGVGHWASNISSDNSDYEIQTLASYNDYLYLGGYFHASSFSFISYNNPRYLTLAGDATYHTGFLARYDKNGKLDWATTQTDPNSDVNLIELAVNANGIYTVGTYSNQVVANSFNLTDTISTKTVSSQSVFINRYLESMPDDFELVDSGNNTILNVYYQSDLEYEMAQTGGITQIMTLKSFIPVGNRYYFGIGTLNGGTVSNLITR